MTVDIKETGDLKTRPFFDVLIETISTDFEGVVVCARGKEKHSVILKNGNFFIPQSYVGEAQLGKYLFEKGILNNDAYMAVKKIQDHEKLTFYQALKQNQNFDGNLIQQFLLEKIKDVILTLFGWESGKYMVVEQLPKDIVEVSPIEAPLAWLFSLRNQFYEKKTPSIANIGYQVDLNAPAFGQVSWKPVQESIIQAIKQTKYIKGIAKSLTLEESQVFAFAKTLIDFKIIVPENQKKESVSQSSNEDYPFNEILQKHEKMNFYQLLGLHKKVLTSEVAPRYFSIAKKYHPDRIKEVKGFEKKDLEKVFAKITQAYQVLSNNVKRKQYDEGLEAPDEKDEFDIKKVLESESNYLDGMDFLRRGQFEQAQEQFQKAIDLYDQEYEYFIRLGWAMYRASLKNNDTEMLQKGKKILTEALKKGKIMDDVFYYHGMIFKQEKEYGKAKVFFQRSIAENKRHTQANLEYQAVQVLIEKKSKTDKKGWFE